MVFSCLDDPIARKQLSLDRTAVSVNVMVGIMIVLIIISTIYFYIVRRHTEKPQFMTAIFVILNYTWLLRFAYIVLITSISDNKYPENDEMQEFRCAISLNVMSSTLICIAHWIFAINYFEVAINS